MLSFSSSPARLLVILLRDDVVMPAKNGAAEEIELRRFVSRVVLVMYAEDRACKLMVLILSSFSKHRAV